MKESQIRSFLDGDIDARWLSSALENDAAATELIADLDESVCLTLEEMRRLATRTSPAASPSTGSKRSRG